MKRCYILLNTETGEIVAYTYISNFDTDQNISDKKILDVRLEAAITDGYIPDENYMWESDNIESDEFLEKHVTQI